MNRFVTAAVVVFAIASGSLLYANSQKEVERQNAAYLQAMMAGRYTTSTNGCTDEFRLLPGHQYAQTLTLADDRTLFKHSGSWKRPLNSPDSLSASDIVLNNVLDDSGVCSVPHTASTPAPGWDFTVPARSFHPSP